MLTIILGKLSFSGSFSRENVVRKGLATITFSLSGGVYFSITDKLMNPEEFCFPNNVK